MHGDDGGHILDISGRRASLRRYGHLAQVQVSGPLVHRRLLYCTVHAARYSTVDATTVDRPVAWPFHYKYSTLLSLISALSCTTLL